MARTGYVAYQSANYSGNEKLVSYNYFTMNYTGGSWPSASTPYRITRVSCVYSKSQAGYTSDTIYKYNDTDGITLGVSGSYWTGEGDNSLYTDLNIYTQARFPTGSGASWRLRMYASGDSAGIITNGTHITFTIYWELTESGSTFTLESGALELARGQSVTAVLNVTEGTSIGKHTVTIQQDGSTALAEREITISGGQASVSLVCDSFAALMPDSTSGIFTVILMSWSASDETRLVGTAQQSLTLTVGASYAPGLTAAVTGRLNEFGGQLLRYVSAATVQGTPTYYGGATGAAMVFTGQNLSRRLTVSDTAAHQADTDTFQKSGTFTFTVTVTDSRGMTATATTGSVTVAAYSFPTGSLAAARYDRTAGRTDASGESARVTLSGLTWSSGITGNSITLALKYKRRTDSAYTTHTEAFTTTMPSSVIIQDVISRDSEYDFLVELTDTVQATIQGLTVNALTATLAAADAFFVFSKAAGKQYFGFGAYPTHSECVEVKPSWGLYAHGKEVLELMEDEISDRVYMGRNLIRGLTEPSTADMATVNGCVFASGTETVRGVNGVVSVAEHGYRITSGSARRPQFFLGHSTSGTQLGVVNEYGESDPLMGLKPGHTYTLSADLEIKLLGGTANATTRYLGCWTNWLKDGAYQGVTLVQHIIYLPTEQKGKVISARMEVPFTVPDDAEGGELYIQASASTAAQFAADDYMEFRNLKLEEGSEATRWSPAPEDTYGDFIRRTDGLLQNAATAADVDGTDITPSSYTVPAIHCIARKYGRSVHLEYYSEVGSVQGYDAVLLTLPAEARPSATRYLPCFFGSRNTTGGNVGYGLVKVGSDGQVTVDLFSGLMHAGGSSAGDSTQTSVLVNGWYEV